ncbi:jg21808 [Pararge aegeria aegeria]|uniref:Jg21808 protein n=1 Tax=Pararge aegeria aegeria TaxID=348720 RepID=A0A8S4QM49_9NEOP|nr:jg21808 [Pararge aegeria aegeria]
MTDEYFNELYIHKYLEDTYKHPDTEKHLCSSHKHFPVVGIEPTALGSESRVAAHCASRPSQQCCMNASNLSDVVSYGLAEVLRGGPQRGAAAWSGEYQPL